ncbi:MULTISPECIES: Arm DNA-binding domain-containing protein [unclassified Halomonas]|uniref:Arm DNA-binding domain-containing protein n=1 Tax=Halomonas sp. N3-2A TaxID=2014541 RepID=UPI001E3658FD|nr:MULTISPECIES: DUF3596 domain-containing protein [unclassified Halomonas]UTD57416.1 DUF3596 domain-containing protein [Halomonas sp. MS1]
MGTRQRKETGKLYLDFFGQGLRLREQTAIKETLANQKNTHRLHLLTAFSNLLMSDKYL